MKKIVALFLVLVYISSIVGCNKAKYTVEIADNYPIANRLKTNYAAGEEVTVKLETITEHYYVLSVNGDEVEMDRDASDLTYTYFTFTMPGEDVLIQIEDKWVGIPPLSPSPVDQCSPITLTIVETEPSGVAFEYREPNTPYCFYAFDEDENLYRVLWTDWDGLREKNRVIVEYEKLEELTYDEYPDGGWNPRYELTATSVNTTSCISNEQGVYALTLPSCGEKITLKDDFAPFVPYIADTLVVAAEKKITDEIAEYSNSSGFYLQISEDYLCLVQEVIHYIDPPETAGEYALSGCGIDHEHLFFSERITLCPVSTQNSTSDNSLWNGIANHFSTYLDNNNFVPGLSQGDFISQVAQYRYHDISVMDQDSSVNYDGPNGGGWYLTNGDLYSFHNDFTVGDMDTKYSNRITTTVPLEGFKLPYGLEFEDTLVETFAKLGISMDPLVDFVPDANSDVTMTLYQDDGVSILYEQWGNSKEPVDFEYPFMLTYTENYEINQVTTVQRTIILRYAYVNNCGLGEAEISVTEWNCLE